MIALELTPQLAVCTLHSVVSAIGLMIIPTFYINRTIKKMWLLKGGERLKLQTYSHLGRSRNLLVRLEDCDFKMPRKVKGTNVSFRVKGHRMMYMMDKQSGHFHEPELFDFAICYHRLLKQSKKKWYLFF